jgi:putative hydrolase of the HAD superfamily
MNSPVWFFDLDDTLHDASHAIFGAIDTRMTDYVQQHLAVERPEANRIRRDYWQRYGATLLGLVRHHGVDPHHFLAQTHDFEVAALLRAERGLGALLARLPGRKVLLTNAPARYAASVLRELAVHGHFPRRYAIEAMRVHGRFRPKPSRSMLAAMLAREGVPGSRAVLVEDSERNLKSAKSLGLATVLVTAHRRASPRRPPYVDAVVATLHELPRVAPGLRFGC